MNFLINECPGCDRQHGDDPNIVHSLIIGDHGLVWHLGCWRRAQGTWWGWVKALFMGSAR